MNHILYIAVLIFSLAFNVLQTQLASETTFI